MTLESLLLAGPRFSQLTLKLGKEANEVVPEAV